MDDLQWKKVPNDSPLAALMLALGASRSPPPLLPLRCLLHEPPGKVRSGKLRVKHDHKNVLLPAKAWRNMSKSPFWAGYLVIP